MMQLHSLLLLRSLCPPSHPDANLSTSIAAACERVAVTLGKHPAHILGKPEIELASHGTHGALRRLRRWQCKSLLQMRRVWCTTLLFLQPKMLFATDQVVKTAMRQWLGLPLLIGPAPCTNVYSSTQHRCGEISDERGRHAQRSCKSQVQARHHALRNTWAAIAVECGCHVALEQEVRLKDGHAKRADTLITGVDGHRHAADVSVTHAWTGSATQAAERAHADKVRAYRATLERPYLPDGDEVVPLVHVAGGMMNDRAFCLADLLCWHLTKKLITLQRIPATTAKYLSRVRVYGRLGMQLACQEARFLRGAGQLA